MGTIKVRNQTTLTDFSALQRAAIYLAGCKAEAENGGYEFKISKSELGTIIRITENEK